MELRFYLEVPNVKLRCCVVELRKLLVILDETEKKPVTKAPPIHASYSQ